MNNSRRRIIKKAIKSLEDIYTDITFAKEEEEMSLENLPESLRYTDRAESMEDYVDKLDDAVYDLGEVLESLRSVIDEK